MRAFNGEQEVVVPCLKRDTPAPFKLHRRRLLGKEIKYKSSDRVQSKRSGRPRFVLEFILSSIRHTPDKNAFSAIIFYTTGPNTTV